jgi:hypothetical protein
VATHDDGTRWVYFTAVRGTEDAPMFSVMRRRFDPSVTEEVLTAPGEAATYYLDANAAISEDGRSLLYADGNGIVRQELASAAETRVIADTAPCTQQWNDCYVHVAPRWSPDSDEIAVQRWYWEGGRALLIDANATTAPPRALEGTTAEWSSADGRLLCASDDFYAPPSWLRVANRDGTVRVVMNHAPGDPGDAWTPFGCVWGRDDRFATAYVASDERCDDCYRAGIAVFDVGGRLVADLRGPDGHSERLVAWVGADALLFMTWETPGAPAVNLVVTLDGRIAPFAIGDGRILAIFE